MSRLRQTPHALMNCQSIGSPTSTGLSHSPQFYEFIPCTEYFCYGSIESDPTHLEPVYFENTLSNRRLNRLRRHLKSRAHIQLEISFACNHFICFTYFEAITNLVHVQVSSRISMLWEYSFKAARRLVDFMLTMPNK